MRHIKIIGVDIFLEKRKTRLHVGRLSKSNGKLVFTYDDHYFGAKNVIPLGPEFPLTNKLFSSKQLFPSLEDRIPSTTNPAYPEYCYVMGIDPNEKDPLVLLSTIGRRGPSSFIFCPTYERKITPGEVVKFREHLGLTTREFAAVFEFSQSTINALERNRIAGSEIQKRLEMILSFPEVALKYLFLNGGYLMSKKLKAATDALKGWDRGRRDATDGT